MSRAAGPTWQTVEHDLTKREAAKIRANWGEFRRYITPPGIPFGWGEWPLREDLKHYCRHHGLIEESDCGRWVTEESLWLFLIDNASDDEAIGTDAVGQEKLPVESPSQTREPRVLVDTHRSKRTQEKQITLEGGDVVNGDGEVGEYLVNLAKGESKPSRAGLAAADPAQETLTGAVARAIDAPGAARATGDAGQATIGAFTGGWVGPMARSEPTVTVPAGASYDSSSQAVTITG